MRFTDGSVRTIIASFLQPDDTMEFDESTRIIEDKLISAFSPERLRLDNDSARHAGRTESHFRVVIVARAFEGQSLVSRQRHLRCRRRAAGPVHALQMRCLTPAEYDAADGDVTLKAPPTAEAPLALELLEHLTD